MSAGASSSACDVSNNKCSRPSDFTGSVISAGKRGNRVGELSTTRVCVEHFSSAKEKRPNEARHKSEISESVYKEDSFQNGNDRVGISDDATRRFYGIDRSKGRVFFGANSNGSSKISKIYLEKSQIPVHMPAVRPVVITKSFHKSIETGGGCTSTSGNKNGDLFRRHIDSVRNEERGLQSSENSSEVAAEPWVCNQQRKIVACSDPGNRVFGLRPLINGYASENFTTEMCSNNEEMRGSSEESTFEHPRGSQCSGSTEISNTCNITIDNVLSSFAATTNISAKKGQIGVRGNCNLTPPGKGRVKFVDAAPTCLERPSHVSSSSGYNNSDGCIPEGMGRSNGGTRVFGPLVAGRGKAAYKFIRGKSSEICTVGDKAPSIECPHQISSRQQVSSCVSKSSRGNKIPNPDGGSANNMEMVYGKKSLDIGRISTRKRKRDSGSTIQSILRPHGMVIEARDLQSNRGSSAISARSRHVRFADQQQDPEVRLLAARPDGMEGGRSIFSLERNKSIHISTVLPHSKSAGKSLQRPGHGSPNNNTSVEDTALVRGPATHVNRRANFDPARKRSASLTTQRRGTSAKSPVATSRVANIRAHLKHSGISGKAADLIMASWRSGTEKQYSAAWRKWSCWCIERGENSVSTSIARICDYLTKLYLGGWQYSTINTHRSAISMTHIPIDGIRVGSHYLVKRLMKGIFNKRPPLPRYVFTWPVGTVFKYLKSLGRNEDLPLKLLSMKTAILVALVSADRGATIVHLNLKYMVQATGVIRFLVSKPTKTTRPGSGVHEIVLERYSADKRICPVHAVKEYISATSEIRGQEDQLFVSFLKPHKAVVSSSVARWIKEIMRAAGIDVSVFKPHSTRSASTSWACRQGVSIPDILKTGDWASATTFQRFYNRPVLHSSFAQAILDGALKSTS